MQENAAMRLRTDIRPGIEKPAIRTWSPPYTKYMLIPRLLAPNFDDPVAPYSTVRIER
jgi:hypothetical protein